MIIKDGDVRVYPSGRVRLCKNCGLSFTRKPSELGGFCSRECYLAHGKAGLRRTMGTFICQGCGTEVSRWKKSINAGKGKFCTPQCYYSWRVANPIENLRTTACPICHNSFIPYGNQRTCSMKCKLAKGYAKRRRTCKSCNQEFITQKPGSSSKYCSKKCSELASRKKPHEFDCLGCGKHIIMRSMLGRKQKYCSRQCMQKHNRGPNNALWRGTRNHERGSTWKEQRDAARKRDGKCMAYFCEWSRTTAMEKLSVDHIVPYRLTKIYGGKEGIDPNHLDNLVSLCRAHHSRKTMAERRLLKGDLIGFRSELSRFIPIEISDRALALWGF